jgi:hypothetical protein
MPIPSPCGGYTGVAGEPLRHPDQCNCPILASLSRPRTAGRPDPFFYFVISRIARSPRNLRRDNASKIARDRRSESLRTRTSRARIPTRRQDRIGPWWPPFGKLWTYGNKDVCYERAIRPIMSSSARSLLISPTVARSINGCLSGYVNVTPLCSLLRRESASKTTHNSFIR